MKTLLTSLLLLGSLSSAWAATTTSPVNKFAYGANIGWMDWRSNLLIQANCQRPSPNS